MQFHVAQNGEKTGPFDRDEVYRRLVAGELKPTDLGWHEGLAEWEPLSKLIPPQVPPIIASTTVFAPAAVQWSPAAAGAPGTSGLAIGSLICGILGFLTLGLTSIPAVIMGHLSLSKIKKSMGALGGKGLAIAGLITGYLCFALFLFAVVASMAMSSFTNAQLAARQMQAVQNAKQLVVGMRLYAADHDSNLPPTLETLFEEGLVTDRKLLEVPGILKANSGWEYSGAGLKDSGDGNTVILISRESYRRGERIVAHLDGSVEVARGVSATMH